MASDVVEQASFIRGVHPARAGELDRLALVATGLGRKERAEVDVEAQADQLADELDGSLRARVDAWPRPLGIDIEQPRHWRDQTRLPASRARSSLALRQPRRMTCPGSWPLVSRPQFRRR